MSKSVKRAYSSTRRQEQAGETRLRILAAAHDLFVDQGYGRTTIAEVASTAGVAVETIYATFRNKRTLLRQVWFTGFRGDEEDVRLVDRPEYAPSSLSRTSRLASAGTPSSPPRCSGASIRCWRPCRAPPRANPQQPRCSPSGTNADSTHAPPTPRPPPRQGNSPLAKPSAVRCWPQPWTARCGSGSSPRAGGPTSDSPPGSATSGPRNWQDPRCPCRRGGGGLRAARVVGDVVDVELHIGEQALGLRRVPRDLRRTQDPASVGVAVLCERGGPRLWLEGLAVGGGAQPVCGDEVDEVMVASKVSSADTV